MGLQATPGVTRGCGERMEGGVYAECGTSPIGKPLEYFLADPPIPYAPDRKRGVQLTQGTDGHYHIVDWVGEQYYPYPADVIEEGRRHGFSRRVARSLEFGRLTTDSRLILVHRKGRWTDVEQYLSEDWPKGWIDMEQRDEALSKRCKKMCIHTAGSREARLHLGKPSIPCIGYHWMIPPADRQEGGYCERNLAQGSYQVWPGIGQPMDEASQPVATRFTPAIIAILPLTHLTVIRDSRGDHEDTARTIRRKVDRIPVSVSDT